MKKLILLLTIIVTSIFVISCKDEKKKEEVKEVSNATVDMKVIFKYNEVDTFKVYYTKSKDANIDGSLMMTLPVNPSTADQELTFVFPVGDVPQLIRLDVGSNKNAKAIEIKNIKVSYDNEVIDNSDWITTVNWSPNENLVYDEKTKIHKIVAVNGIQSPVFMSNIILKDKIQKYFTDKK